MLIHIIYIFVVKILIQILEGFRYHVFENNGCSIQTNKEWKWYKRCARWPAQPLRVVKHVAPEISSPKMQIHVHCKVENWLGYRYFMMVDDKTIYLKETTTEKDIGV